MVMEEDGGVYVHLGVRVHHSGPVRSCPPPVWNLRLSLSFLLNGH